MKKGFTYLLLFIIGIAIIIGSCNSQKKGWISLFDGKTLSGWIDDSAACYIEDGAIVGEMSRTMRYLRTEKIFDNFIMEIDFKADDGFNSGVQFRSYFREKDTIGISVGGGSGKLSPREITFKAGQFCGYQIEIETSDRAWCGGLFEQGGRSWLQPLNHNEPARKAYKHNDWNHFEIIANGYHIQSWLNGAEATDFIDREVASGFIGLQFHSTGDSTLIGRKVRFKNIRIKEL
jgi:hypothetical protein